MIEPAAHRQDLPQHETDIDERYFRGARLTAKLLRDQIAQLQRSGIHPDVITTAVLGVAIERLVQVQAPEDASAWLIGIAQHLAGHSDTVGRA